MRKAGEWAGRTSRAFQAGLDALDGRRAEAKAGYREVLAAFREGDCPLDLALTGVDMVAALGPDDADAIAAARESRSILEGLGATVFLARLDALESAGPTRVEREGSAVG
jgi:hypothetical protein